MNKQSHIIISNKPANILNEQEFNAHQDEASRQAMIARTAPEMLEELKRIVQVASANAGTLHWDDVQITKAIIAKAENTIAFQPKE